MKEVLAAIALSIWKLLAWLIFGQVEHRWQIAISVAINALDAIVVGVRGQQLWLAMFLAFMVGGGLVRLQCWPHCEP